MTNICAVITSLILSWSADTSTNIGGYTIVQNESTRYEVTNNSCMVSNLIPGKEYRFKVYTWNTLGLESDYGSIEVTIPMPDFMVLSVPLYDGDRKVHEFRWTNSPVEGNHLYHLGQLSIWSPQHDTNIFPRVAPTNFHRTNIIKRPYPQPPMPL